MTKLQWAQDAVRNSSYLVCLQGIHVSSLCGCTDYRSTERVYDIETKYGYSPEEMFSANYLNNRPKEFFDFYRQEVLRSVGEPEKGIYSLARLEKQGKLKYIITRELFSLAKRAGCTNVLELHGSVYNNQCPHCKEHYTLEFMRKSEDLPVCPKCGATVRPNVCLRGEMLDNALVTRAADAVGRADVLLILGTNMNSYLCNTMVKYFSGSKIILVHEKPHYTDSQADLVINGNPLDILPQIVI